MVNPPWKQAPRATIRKTNADNQLLHKAGQHNARTTMHTMPAEATMAPHIHEWAPPKEYNYNALCRTHSGKQLYKGVGL